MSNGKRQGLTIPPACVHVMQQPSSEEWHIVIGPLFIVDACCIVNRDCVIIYNNAALDGNKLVQLRGLSTICLMVQSASRPQHVESSRSDLKYRTHMKHMYMLFNTSRLSLIRINGALMKH
jgi:hypothetical protein